MFFSRHSIQTMELAVYFERKKRSLAAFFPGNSSLRTGDDDTSSSSSTTLGSVYYPLKEGEIAEWKTIPINDTFRLDRLEAENRQLALENERLKGELERAKRNTDNNNNNRPCQKRPCGLRTFGFYWGSIPVPLSERQQQQQQRRRATTEDATPYCPARDPPILAVNEGDGCYGLPHCSSSNSRRYPESAGCSCHCTTVTIEMPRSTVRDDSRSGSRPTVPIEVLLDTMSPSLTLEEYTEVD